MERNQNQPPDHQQPRNDLDDHEPKPLLTLRDIEIEMAAQSKLRGRPIRLRDVQYAIDLVRDVLGELEPPEAARACELLTGDSTDG